MSIKQGEYLKKLRNENGLSQDALSEILGISRQSVSKWEQGNSTPDIENLNKLAEYYGVSIDSLVKGEPDGESEPKPQAEKAEAPKAQIPDAADTVKPVDNGGRKNKKEKKKRSWLFPSYPILTVIVYCLFGALYGAGGWKTGWIVLLTIPLYYTGVIAQEKKKPIIFCYPVLVLIIYLLLGFGYSLWHPAWIIFLTIPIFYIICAKAGKHNK